MLHEANYPDGNGLHQKNHTDTEVAAMIREVSRTLYLIDSEHTADLESLKKSTTAAYLKSHIRNKLVAGYRERREPHVALLAELHKQQHFPALAT